MLAVFGSPGGGRGQLDQPVALAVTPFGDVWVADQGNSRVEEFSASGHYRTSFAVPTPAGVGLDIRGDVWVSSPAYAPGNSVREFSPAGRQLRSFGATQAGYGDLGDPGGIAVGPAGRIYVAQPDYGLVSVFSPAGRFYTEFGLQPGTGQADEDLEFPQGLAVTATGQIWVADSGHNRVVQFGRVPGVPATGAPTAPGNPSRPLIIGECLLALVIAGLGWHLARRRRANRGPADPPVGTPSPAPASSRPELTRRRLLTTATTLSGVAMGAAALPAGLRKALAATLKDPPGGSHRDIEHIVILMQENRSFDHYFGTMPGVRGFSDPAAIRLPDGSPVFRQPDPGRAQGYLTPFRLDTTTTSAQATPGTDHSWASQHAAWNNGKMDQWVQAKGPFTMGYFTQADIPFQWALAQAFTICDNYYCSVLGPTNPNRLYMWTGMIDPAGTGGGPVTDDSPAYNNVILSWTTYPERLQRAGISWRVYQEEDNYDDNALAWFKQFTSAPVSSPLRQRGMRKAAGAGSSTMPGRDGCRRCPGWSRRPRKPSIRTTSRPRAQSTSPASWTRSRPRGPVAQDPVHPDLRRERRAVRPRAPAGRAPRDAGRVRGRRADRARLPGPGRGGLAVVGGRPCLLGRARPHLADPRHRERFGVPEPKISTFRRRMCGDFSTALRFPVRRPATRGRRRPSPSPPPRPGCSRPSRRCSPTPPRRSR